MSKWTIALVAVLGLSVSAGTATAGLINGGFETTENVTTGWWPVAYSQDWVGDEVHFVGAENGVTPVEGSQMIRFVGSGYDGPSRANTASQLGQLVELDSTEGDGNHTANISGWFNRVAGDAQTDTRFTLDLYAMSGDPADSTAKRVNEDWLDMVSLEIFSNDDPADWEQAQGSMLIPSGADYLLVFAVAYENVHNDSGYPEYDGHYADDIQLNITAPIGDDDDPGDDDDDQTPSADFRYNFQTGEVILQSTSGHLITSFLLLSDDEFQGGTDFPESWPGSNTDLANVISYIDLDAGGFFGQELGAILEAGYTKEELMNEILDNYTFYVEGTNGPWDFNIQVFNVPEPITMSLLATGGLAMVLRRRRRNA
jgi:hypothetical protein